MVCWYGNRVLTWLARYLEPSICLIAGHTECGIVYLLCEVLAMESVWIGGGSDGRGAYKSVLSSPNLLNPTVC